MAGCPVSGRVAVPVNECKCHLFQLRSFIIEIVSSVLH